MTETTCVCGKVRYQDKRAAKSAARASQTHRIAHSKPRRVEVDRNYIDGIYGPQIGADGLRISAASCTEHGCWPMCRDCKRQRYKRTPIPADVRQAVFDRDGNRCLACGTTDGLALDHVTPISLGGRDEIGNLQTLCAPCNSRKGVTEVDYR